ncbi:nucleoside triphosphate pyrophosphohydrolase family protein [Patescibacteria group bacterium]|nr:nucleoside triphosphate pyrophosphohydrolase family protein [Patescibacteria group bacterium]
MNFSEYQKESRKTALYPNQDNNYIYPTLGLAGESGEVSEKIKKIIRDKEGIVQEEDRLAIEKELGDVLWYLSQLASELEIDLESVAQRNIEKLQSRLERGVLSGSGDDR